MFIKGWVYVISNPAIPSLLKIGFSLKDPTLRARELANTGAPHQYKVEYEALLENPLEVEQRAHRHLATLREGREWFRCSLQQAISAVQLVAQGPIFLENNYSGSSTAEKENNSDTSATSLTTRPLGTYAGACKHCGSYVSFTLRPDDVKMKCPECFRFVDVGGFGRREFIL